MEKVNLLKNKKTLLDNSKGFQRKGFVNFYDAFFWQKIARTMVLALVVLAPLFFLPFTLDPLGVNKQFLLIIFVFLALLCYVVASFLSKTFKFYNNPLNVPVAIFLVVYGLSTLFSVSIYKSFWGQSIGVPFAFLTLLFFIFLYFLIINLFTKAKGVLGLVLMLLSSGGLIALINAFQLFGVFIFPWDFAKNPAFNPIGSPNFLSLFFAILMPLLFAVVFSGIIGSKAVWVMRFTGLLFLLNLILINFKTAWIVLALGMATFFFFGFFLRDGYAFKNKIILYSILTLTCSLVFITVGQAVSPVSNLPSEVSLSYSTSLSIAKESLLRSPILGTGPGVFAYDYAKYKPSIINKTDFWDSRFENGASGILDRLTAIGIFGIIAFFFILLKFFNFSFAYFKEAFLAKKENENFILAIGIFVAFFSLILGYFLHASNFVLEMVFWTLLASFVVLAGPEAQMSKVLTKKQEVVVPVFLIAFLISSFLLFLSFTPKYLAEAKYFRGLEYSKKGDIERSINLISEATTLSPSVDIYFRDLAFLYLTKIEETLNQQDLSQESLGLVTGDFIAKARNATEVAVNNDPKDVTNWNLKGFIYQNFIGLIDGASEVAIEAYKKAQELEPMNPNFAKEIGRVYIVKADSSTEEPEKMANLKLARESLEASVNLKPDFAQSHFLLAMISLRENKRSEAIEKLESTKQFAPYDADLYFQLGVLYYEDTELSLAQSAMETAIMLREGFANAHYFLGLIYDKQERKDDAILQFELLEQMGIQSQEIQNILSNLRSGRSALEGITQDSNEELIDPSGSVLE